ncbi:MAG: DUF1329 domain-containing protein [Deltaproteobacteria bacterium]|nr:DUF1329 domain-containing protein [Deltaproteobacteria bacterium]
MKEYKELNYWHYWTRRDFLKKTGVWAGAGLIQPVLSLIGEGKSIAAAYPEEVLSIEKYTKGRVKPGMTISKDNADLVKELCPEGLYAELTRGAQIQIAATTTRADAVVPPYWVEATLRNKGQAVLDKKGQLWTKDGKPWIGGDPFPEPKSGVEGVWNSIFNFRRYDDVRSIAWELDVDSNGTVVRKGASFFTRIQAVGRVAVAPKPIIPQYKDELYRTILSVVEPFDSYGLAITTTNKYDATLLPDTDLYIPTLRRTRRVPSTQRFEPPRPYAAYFASDFDVHNDPLLTWSWNLVARKPMLDASPANTGARAEGATKNSFIFPFTDDKFPRSTWELRPDVLIVEGIPHIEGAPYSKKRVYVDAIYNRAQCADTWDKAGKLWKWFVFFFGRTGVRDKTVTDHEVVDLTGISFADLQKDYHTNVWQLNKIGNVDFRVNAGFKIDDWATPSAMLRNARR